MLRTITKKAKFKFKEKRSEFISFVEPVKSVEEVKRILQKYKKEFPDATHICYAYVLEDNEFCSDAGEPKGSAGPPILNAIKKEQLVNLIVIVVRYFGGTKLGIRGLINAYSYAAQKVLELVEKIPYVPKKTITIEVPYNKLNKFYYKLNKANGKIIEQKSNQDSLSLTIEIPKDKNIKI